MEEKKKEDKKMYTIIFITGVAIGAMMSRKKYYNIGYDSCAVDTLKLMFK